MKFLMWLPLAGINILARGLTLKFLWGWFVLSQWHNAPNLSVAACLGLSTLVGLFSARQITKQEWAERDKFKHEVDETELGIANAAVGILVSGITLLTGYLIHLCM